MKERDSALHVWKALPHMWRGRVAPHNRRGRATNRSAGRSTRAGQDITVAAPS